MRLLIEVEHDEDCWVASATDGPMALVHGSGSTVQSALHDLAESLVCYAESVQDGARAGDQSDVALWEALRPLVERG